MVRIIAVGFTLLLALVLGALWPMNTWDVPTYAFLAVLALVLTWHAGPRRAPLSGLLTLGLPPSGEEIARALVMLVVTIFYAGVWLALAMLLSTVFRSLCE